MGNWLTANEWIFGLMGGMLLFFLGNAAKGYWDKQRGQDEDIKSLGEKLDLVNLNLVAISNKLENKPSREEVDKFIERGIQRHEESHVGHKPLIVAAEVR